MLQSRGHHKRSPPCTTDHWTKGRVRCCRGTALDGGHLRADHSPHNRRVGGHWPGGSCAVSLHRVEGDPRTCPEVARSLCTDECRYAPALCLKAATADI